MKFNDFDILYRPLSENSLNLSENILHYFKQDEQLQNHHEDTIEQQEIINDEQHHQLIIPTANMVQIMQNVFTQI